MINRFCTKFSLCCRSGQVQGYQINLPTNKKYIFKLYKAYKQKQNTVIEGQASKAIYRALEILKLIIGLISLIITETITIFSSNCDNKTDGQTNGH